MVQTTKTDLTDETAKQQAEGTSPVTDDASADAERAVADEPTPAARNRRIADENIEEKAHGSSVHDRLDALEADLARLRAQLRHSL